MRYLLLVKHLEGEATSRTGFPSSSQQGETQGCRRLLQGCERCTLFCTARDEPQALHTIGKGSTPELHSQPQEQTTESNRPGPEPKGFSELEVILAPGTDSSDNDGAKLRFKQSL